jgi:molecular chaperone GrpE
MKKNKQDMNKKSKKEEMEEKEPVTPQQEVTNTAAETDALSDETATPQKPALEEATEADIKLEELGSKLNDINDKYLRLSAEFDNYRKRTLKEKMELTKSAGEGILKGILPVVDDFDRALAHLDDAKDIQAIKDGIGLIYNKFKEFLNQQGVKEIEAKDQPFDTDLHEAITKIPAPAEEMKGKVIDCVEKGYLLNEKVIRFSKVVVGE